MQIWLGQAGYAGEHWARVIGVMVLVLRGSLSTCVNVEVVCALAELAAHPILQRAIVNKVSSQVDR